MDANEKKKISAGDVLSLAGRILFGALIALLVFVAAVLAYDKYVKKSPMPSFFGNSVLIVATPSMSGSIEAGDTIIVRRNSSYEVGDVISYFPAGDTVSVTHRIVRIEGEKYYTKGDANISEDPDPVFIGQIAGKVVRIIPKAGIILEWLKTWQGIAFMIAVGAVIVALVMVCGEREEVDDGMLEADDIATTEGGSGD